MKFVRRRPRACLAVLAAILMGSATVATSASADFSGDDPSAWPEQRGDISVLTYNVKGLPAPLAFGRGEMLERIGQRLAAMRAMGRNPSVVVLQEAFTPEAKRIAELAGYRFIVMGPDTTVAQASLQDDAAKGRERSWLLGETQGAQVDSGLMLLSDFPVIEVHRAPFPRDACAGFDCLAAKGVLMVTLDVAGKGPVTVATTHFNSRGASRAPEADTHEAYQAQATFLADYVTQTWKGDTPLIIAGDFNMGKRPFRMRALPDALDSMSGHAQVRDALGTSMAKGVLPHDQAADASWIRKRARDLQFVVPASGGQLEPVGASVPFGSEQGGESLSDHFGFVIDYKFIS